MTTILMGSVSAAPALTIPVSTGLLGMYTPAYSETYNPASSTTDLNSVNGNASYKTQRGDGTTSSTFPTVHGVGLLFDGNDYVGLVGSNTAAIDSFSKVGATWTFWYAGKFGSAASVQYLMSTFTILGTVGVSVYVDQLDRLTVQVSGDTGTPVLQKYVDTAFSLTDYHFAAVSINENGSGFFRYNNAYRQVASANTFSATYTNPSTSGASSKLTFFAQSDNGLYKASDGSQFAAWGFHDAALSAAECDDIYDWLNDTSTFRCGFPLPPGP